MKKIEQLYVPVQYFMSSSGKTYYAMVGLNGDYYTGESRISYEEALVALQDKIKKEIL